MSDLQVTASCTAASGDDASLDGSVTISVDGVATVYDGLSDGAVEFAVAGTEASFAVTADVQCDGTEPGVTYEAVGVGVAPVPGSDPVPSVDATAAVYSAYALPATGLDGGGLAALALAAVVAGAALVRIARRVAA